MENKEYLQALFAFQSECPQIKREEDAGEKGGQFHFVYAPIDQILRIVKPYLVKNGFAYRFEKRAMDGISPADMEEIVCIGYHIPSGQSMESVVRADYKTEFEFLRKMIEGTAAKKGYYRHVDIHKERGKIQTYCERYAFNDLFGTVTTKEDVEVPSEIVEVPTEREEREAQYSNVQHDSVTTITDKQHRRLEARINENGLDRERVKTYCKRTLGIDHLTELPQSKYEALDAKLEEWKHLPISEPQKEALKKLAAGIDLDEFLSMRYGSTLNNVVAGEFKQIKEAITAEAKATKADTE